MNSIASKSVFRQLEAFELDLVSGGDGDDGEIVVIGHPGDDGGDGGYDGPGYDPGTGGDGGDGGAGDPGEGGGYGSPGEGGGITDKLTDAGIQLVVDLLKNLSYNAIEVGLRNISYAVYGGYHGENVGPDHIDTIGWGTNNNAVLYRQVDSGNYYIDRDGNGQVDAGLVYNRATGIIAIDNNADGVGDSVLTDTTP